MAVRRPLSQAWSDGAITAKRFFEKSKYCWAFFGSGVPIASSILRLAPSWSPRAFASRRSNCRWTGPPVGHLTRANVHCEQVGPLFDHVYSDDRTPGVA